MALFKCKMCGGSLEIAAGTTVIECEYCGTQQTLPKLDDEKRAHLYDRANHFRRNNEFDKAMGIYEQVLNEDHTDAEAYWSLVLCRYGIEYVEDPATRKHIPTINRAQYTSIFDDDNYKSALLHADSYQRILYEEEAKTINEIQKGILAISQKEEPFDVFICYKETDANGRRTRDSVLAQELYYQLKQEGFKVFFSRITLEDKLGTAYEPYIFAALNSAKVMVVLGTKPEFFNAVWVKNEWSRYLALIKQGQKKMLIPAYRDMDPYNLPEEFSHLQAQDMSKLGFMQDLIRGIKKIVKADEPKTTVVTAVAGNTSPLLKRAFIFLEDGDWESADEYCEKVLDMDPENAYAYLGKLMAELHIPQQELFKNCPQSIDGNKNFQKALRYANDTLKVELKKYAEYSNTNARLKYIQRLTNALAGYQNARMERTYVLASSYMATATTGAHYQKAAQLFSSISGYRDADILASNCLAHAQKAKAAAAAEAERVAEAKRAAEQARIAEQARAAEQARIKEEQSRARAAQFAEERRLADEKIEAERIIIAQKNKISRRFVGIASLFSVAVIVIGVALALIAGAVFPDDELGGIGWNMFYAIFMFIVMGIVIAPFPHLFALLSMLITHKASKAKRVFMIIALISAIISGLWWGLVGLVAIFDPSTICLGVATIVPSILNILACIYMIALKILLAIKKKQIEQNATTSK